jgi:hypothetical protein
MHVRGVSSNYEPVVSPRDVILDREDYKEPVDGFRQSLVDLFTEMYRNLPRRDRQGFLSALYALNSAALPPGYYRPLSIVVLQAQVRRAVTEIENERRAYG